MLKAKIIFCGYQCMFVLTRKVKGEVPVIYDTWFIGGEHLPGTEPLVNATLRILRSNGVRVMI